MTSEYRLKWSEERPSNAEVGYNHVVAQTPLGEILITWKGWKKYPSFDAELPMLDAVGSGYLGIMSANDLHTAKLNAERTYIEVVRKAAEELGMVWPSSSS